MTEQPMSVAEAITTEAVLKTLLDEIDAQYKAARAAVQQALDTQQAETGGTKFDATIPGADGPVKVGTVSLSSGSAAAQVTDGEAFLVWARKAYPTEVQPRVTFEIQPAWRTDLLARATADGPPGRPRRRGGAPCLTSASGAVTRSRLDGPRGGTTGRSAPIRSGATRTPKPRRPPVPGCEAWDGEPIPTTNPGAVPVDFLTVDYADGRQWTHLSRLTDGRIMCCLCFAYCTRDQFSIDPTDGQLTDVCQPCRTREEQHHA